MEIPQYCIAMDEGLYGNWRAIGVMEDLDVDGDIAQFLVTLYCSLKQRDREECSIKCVHCHRPLTLFCNTCQHPSHLATPTQLPPPSLSSTPPALSSQVLPSSTHLCVLTDTEVKGDQEKGDGLLPCGHHGFNEHSLNIDVVKTKSAVSTVCNCEPGPVSSTQPVTELDFTPSSRVERTNQSLTLPSKNNQTDTQEMLTEKPALTSHRGRNKRKTRTDTQLDNSAKKKQTDLTESYTGSSLGNARNKKWTRPEEARVSAQLDKVRKKKPRKPNQHEHATNSFMTGKSTRKIRENVHSQTKEGTNRESSENDSSQNEAANTRQWSLRVRKGQKKKRKKPCVSHTVEQGFVISEEQRRLAQIHEYDVSYFEQHRIELEHEPSRGPGRPKKRPDWQISPVNTVVKTKGRPKSEGICIATASTNSSRRNIDPEVSKFDPLSSVGCDAETSRKESTEESVEPHDTDKQSFRILVSAQRILPLMTTDGKHIRKYYSYFECAHCKKAFERKTAFNSHIQKHIGLTLYSCTWCGKDFKRPSARQRHERTHTFDCDVCGKKFPERTKLHEHSKLHTENDGVMKCAKCKFQTKDFHVYEKHRTRCITLQCDICGVRLKSMNALRFHIAAIHKNDRPYKCTVCEKSFVLKTKLNTHMKYKHAEGGRLFHCDQCSYRAFDARGLTMHQSCVHSNERPYKCTYCPSAFARKFYLTIHIRKHTGERPYRCNVCSQAFAQRPSLTRHRKTHHHFEPIVDREMVESQNPP